MALQPRLSLGRLVLRLIGHTNLRHTYVSGRIPLNERSVRRKGRYLPNTDQTQDTNILPSTGFELAIPTIKQLETCAEGEVSTLKSVYRPIIEG